MGSVTVASTGLRLRAGQDAVLTCQDAVMIPSKYCCPGHYQSKEPGELEEIGGHPRLTLAYAHNPTRGLTAHEAQRILGLQANLWTEYICTRDRLDHMVYPRPYAIAETAWTRRGMRSFAEFEARLASHLPKIRELSVKYIAKP